MLAELDELDSTTGWLPLFHNLNWFSRERVGTVKIGRSPENRQLNRYRDVLAYDHSRIILEPKEGQTDYINANLVQASKVNRRYILTQGPLPHTSSHFWQMIWENKSQAIIMLNRVIEKKQIKCYQYWPCGELYDHTNVLEFKNFKITYLHENRSEYFTVRTLELENIETQEKRTVYHFHYLHWPDFGVPPSPETFLSFLFEARNAGVLSEDVGPAVIHCSAGIGRSGTYIMVDSILAELEENQDLNKVNIKQTLLDLRQYRVGLIQTPDQLRFTYLAILEGTHMLMPDVYQKALDQFMNETDRSFGPEDEPEEEPPPLPPRRKHPEETEPEAGDGQSSEKRSRRCLPDVPTENEIDGPSQTSLKDAHSEGKQRVKRKWKKGFKLLLPSKKAPVKKAPAKIDAISSDESDGEDEMIDLSASSASSGVESEDEPSPEVTQDVEGASDDERDASTVEQGDTRDAVLGGAIETITGTEKTNEDDSRLESGVLDPSTLELGDIETSISPATGRDTEANPTLHVRPGSRLEDKKEDDFRPESDVLDPSTLELGDIETSISPTTGGDTEAIPTLYVQPGSRLEDKKEDNSRPESGILDPSTLELGDIETSISPTTGRDTEANPTLYVQPGSRLEDKKEDDFRPESDVLDPSTHELGDIETSISPTTGSDTEAKPTLHVQPASMLEDSKEDYCRLESGVLDPSTLELGDIETSISPATGRDTEAKPTLHVQPASMLEEKKEDDCRPESDVLDPSTLELGDIETSISPTTGRDIEANPTLYVQPGSRLEDKKEDNSRPESGILDPSTLELGDIETSISPTTGRDTEAKPTLHVQPGSRLEDSKEDETRLESGVLDPSTLEQGDIETSISPTLGSDTEAKPTLYVQPRSRLEDKKEDDSRPESGVLDPSTLEIGDIETSISSTTGRDTEINPTLYVRPGSRLEEKKEDDSRPESDVLDPSTLELGDIENSKEMSLNKDSDKQQHATSPESPKSPGTVSYLGTPSVLDSTGEQCDDDQANHSCGKVDENKSSTDTTHLKNDNESEAILRRRRWQEKNEKTAQLVKNIKDKVRHEEDSRTQRGALIRNTLILVAVCSVAYLAYRFYRYLIFRVRRR